MQQGYVIPMLPELAFIDLDLLIQLPYVVLMLNTVFRCHSLHSRLFESQVVFLKHLLIVLQG